MHLELESDYRLRDGGLPGEYRGLYLTFHWGPTNITGSEHTIDGTAYAMEVMCQVKNAVCMLSFSHILVITVVLLMRCRHKHSDL